jgi:hypothetical protein
MIAYVRCGYSNLEGFVSTIINKAFKTCLSRSRNEESEPFFVEDSILSKQQMVTPIVLESALKQRNRRYGSE